MRGNEAQKWLLQAEADLCWAERLAGETGYCLACFLCQQAAEKALKALLYASGEEIVFGHSVSELTERASRICESLRKNIQRWGFLDAFYIPTRYPNGLPSGGSRRTILTMMPPIWPWQGSARSWKRSRSACGNLEGRGADNHTEPVPQLFLRGYGGGPNRRSQLRFAR